MKYVIPEVDKLVPGELVVVSLTGVEHMRDRGPINTMEDSKTLALCWSQTSRCKCQDGDGVACGQ